MLIVVLVSEYHIQRVTSAVFHDVRLPRFVVILHERACIAKWTANDSTVILKVLRANTIVHLNRCYLPHKCAKWRVCLSFLLFDDFGLRDSLLPLELISGVVRVDVKPSEATSCLINWTLVHKRIHLAVLLLLLNPVMHSPTPLSILWRRSLTSSKVHKLIESLMSIRGRYTSSRQGSRGLCLLRTATAQ